MSAASSSNRYFVSTICLFIILLLSGCATTAEINDRYAEKHGMQRAEYLFAFPHIIYQKPGNNESGWHIYIEGDGRPWLKGSRVATDPTTEKPLMLRLIAQDTAQSIYLGRPCYNLHQGSTKCHPYYWTHGRYSEAVVKSLTSLINKLISINNINQITLIGYSGGGTLTMLLAERLLEVNTIVTLAGNLDIDAWTDAHGYTRMQGSLNPALREPLPARIEQYHYLGRQDRNITATMVNPVVKKQGKPELLLLDNFDHDCCWETDWPVFLSKLRYLTKHE